MQFFTDSAQIRFENFLVLAFIFVMYKFYALFTQNQKINLYKKLTIK